MARGGDILVEGNFDEKESRALAAAVAGALPLKAGGPSFPTPRGLALPKVPVVLRIGAEEIGTEERNSAAELLEIGEREGLSIHRIMLANERTFLPEDTIRDLVLMKLNAVGLRGARDLFPSELSGGMSLPSSPSRR